MTRRSGGHLTKEFQAKYWEEHTSARHYSHPVVRLFAQQRLEYLTRYVDLQGVKTAFDVGCGDGFSSYYLDQVIDHVEGGDISSTMLKKNPLPRERLRIVDAESLPLTDGSFDLVSAWEVLHHVPNAQMVVREMARVARQWVVIFEPNRVNLLQFLFGTIVRAERGTLRSTRSFLTRICEQADLEIVRADYCGKIPPNKTPLFLLPMLRRLPFRGNIFSAISIVVVARKKPPMSLSRPSA